jgi:hypothetical protein
MKTIHLPKLFSPTFILAKFSLVILVQFCALLLPAQDNIPCLWPAIPPYFSVSETHWDEPQSFWQNGGHIPENLINMDSTDFARAHIMLTGSATVRVSQSDSAITLNEGVYAGFFIKSAAFRDSMFDGVTISTYVNGVLQESFTGNDLMIGHIPEFVNEPIHIGFIVTRIFNEIELTLDGAGGNVHYDVFFAVIQDCNINPNVLPVTWLSFEARQENKIVNLEWVNTAEINNAGFEVERSADGANFNSIGKVSPGRDLNDINVYTYNDEAPLKGINYYRIKQVDHDGKVNYSQIRSVMFLNKDVDVMVWPNPASESLVIDLGIHEEEGTIKIVSPTGMIIFNQPYTSTVQRVSLDITSLEAGMYGVMVESPNAKHINKLVVIR